MGKKFILLNKTQFLLVIWGKKLNRNRKDTLLKKIILLLGNSQRSSRILRLKINYFFTKKVKIIFCWRKRIIERKVAACGNNSFGWAKCVWDKER